MAEYEFERNKLMTTTTISTIAVQSGRSRIVIALLQSKDLLQLKVLELVPDLTSLGENFEKASELEKEHDNVLQQIQNKQNPVDALLRKADQAIVDQKPKAEVYSAMADSLGEAWKEVNNHLMTRKQILHLNVTYHSQAEACVERMKALEALCKAPMPVCEKAVKETLQCMKDVRRCMLECLVTTLKSGQNLLIALNEIASMGSVEYRPGHIRNNARSAIAKVERWLEELHNKRTSLQIQWQNRELSLEKYRTLILLKSDLELLEQLLSERYESLLDIQRLTDLAHSSNQIYTTLQTLHVEAKCLQDEAIRILKFTEQLFSPLSHLEDEDAEISKRAYDVLNRANEYIQEIDKRQKLLKKIIDFYDKYDNFIQQIPEVNILGTSALDTKEKEIKSLTWDGKYLLSKLPNSTDIKRSLEDIEQKHSIFKERIREDSEIIKYIDELKDKCSKYHSWMMDVVEAFIRNCKNMGDNTKSCQEFFQQHKKFLVDVEVQNAEFRNHCDILRSNNILSQIDEKLNNELNEKINAINKYSSYLLEVLHTRISLCNKYFALHTLSDSLNNLFDQLDGSDTSKLFKTNCTEIKKQIDRYLIRFRSDSDIFIKDLSKAKDISLDVAHAHLTMQTLLQYFSKKKDATGDNFWNKSYKSDFWKSNIMESNEARDWISKLEAKLYPVLDPNSTEVSVQVKEVEEKLNNILPEIKRVEQEISSRIDTAQELLSKGELDDNDGIPPRLKELHRTICNIILDYSTLVEMFTSFLDSVKQLQEKVKELKLISSLEIKPYTLNELKEARNKLSNSSHAFQDMFNIAHSECQQLINKIKQKEPDKFRNLEVKCVQDILEENRSTWEEISTEWEQRLKRWDKQMEFDKDLANIHKDIDKLSQELDNLRTNHSSSITSLDIFQHFENTTQLLDRKILAFIKSAEKALQLPEVEIQLNNLQNKWQKLYSNVKDTKEFIQSNSQLFSLINEAEQWFRQGTKLLISIAGKSSSIKTFDEASHLLNEVNEFLKSAGPVQAERIETISRLSSRFSGNNDQSLKISQILSENNDMLDSFSSIMKELLRLQEKLKKEPFTLSVKEESKYETDVVIFKNFPTTLSVQNVEIVHLSEDSSSKEEMEASDTSIQFQTSKENNILNEPTESQKPTFIISLRDSTIKEGSKFTLQCKVIGNPSPEITWLKDAIPIDNNPDYKTTYDNGVCSLTIEETFVDDSAKYTCSASNKAGVAETHAHLTVEEHVTEEELESPKFSIGLRDQQIMENETCELYCKVLGYPLPTVQWFKNDECIDQSANYIFTYNNGDAKMIVQNITLENQAKYTCVATNRLGTDKTYARIIVQERNESAAPPRFVQPLPNIMARAGQKVKLTCSVTGYPTPDFVWVHDGKPLKESRDIKMLIDGDNVTLTIQEAFPKHAGMYVLTAKNQAGEASSTSKISVKGLLPCETSDSEIPSDFEPSRPKLQESLRDVTAIEGNPVFLECVIVAQPEPEVIWYHKNIPVKESSDIQLFFHGDKCSLHLKECSLEDSGEYKVIAVNSAGEISSSCQLKVIEKLHHGEVIPSAPRFTKLLTDILVREGDDVILECSVSGTPKPIVKWILNSDEILMSDRIKCIEESDGHLKLIIHDARPTDKGLITARASNSLGEAKCFSHIIVKSLSSINSTTSSGIYLQDRHERPAFVEMFSDKEVLEGENAKFECIISGKPSPKVKWYFNGEPVAGKSFLVSTSGDRQVLSIPVVEKDHAGIISCVAENEVGKATCTGELAITCVTTEQLIPTLDAKMNIFESCNSFETKRAMFIKSTTTGDNAPVVQTDSYQTSSERISTKLNDQEANKIESCHTEEYHKINNLTSQETNDNLHFKKNIGQLKSKRITAPKFLTTIDGAIVNEGVTVKFEAVVEGYPIANPTWSKNNNELKHDPGKIEITNISNHLTLVIKDVDSNDSGSYQCTVSNDAGSCSCSADLFVKKKSFPPVMGRRLQPQSVCVGKRVIFEIEVTGTPDPTVTWYKDGQQLPNNSPFYRMRHQGNSYALIFESVRESDSGQYKVKAINEAGESISIANLHVIPTPPSPIAFSSSISTEGTSSLKKTYGQEGYIKNSQINEQSLVKDDVKLEKLNLSEVVKINKEISLKLERENVISKFPPQDQIEKNAVHTEKYTNQSNDFDQNYFIGSHCASIPCNSQPGELYPLKIPGVGLNINSEEKLQEYFKEYNNETKYISTSNDNFILEPGPPPEMGYIPKPSTPRAKEPMVDRVKKLQSTQRILSPVEIPVGAIRIFPSPHLGENLKDESWTSSHTSTNQYTEEITDRKLLSTCNLNESEGKPIYRHQANISLRPLSPRPSAEAVSMEKLWASNKKSVGHLDNKSSKTKEDEIDHDNRITPINGEVISKSSKLTLNDTSKDMTHIHESQIHKIEKESYLSSTNTETKGNLEDYSKINSFMKPSGNVKCGTLDSAVSQNENKNVENSLRSIEKPSCSKENGNYKEAYTSCNTYKSFRDVNSNNKLPHHEVSFEDSLVRKDTTKSQYTKQHPALSTTAFPQPISDEYNQSHFNSQNNQSTYILPHALKSLSPTITQFSDQNKFSTSFSQSDQNKSTTWQDKSQFSSTSYSTLPRSFKFHSSGDSKFRPVTPSFYTKQVTSKFTDSEYETDSEVSKISKKLPFPRPLENPNLRINSSNILPTTPFKNQINTESNESQLQTYKSFTGIKKNTNFPKCKFDATNNKTKPEYSVKKESGYFADTEETSRNYNLFKSRDSYAAENTSMESGNNYKYTACDAGVSPHIVQDKKNDRNSGLTYTSSNSQYVKSNEIPDNKGSSFNVPVFTKREIRESDYESDYDGKIQSLWRPQSSYKPINPSFKSSGEFKSVTPVSNYYDTSVLIPKPVVTETSQQLNISESTSNGHRIVNMKQATRVIDFNNENKNTAFKVKNTLQNKKQNEYMGENNETVLLKNKEKFPFQNEKDMQLNIVNEKKKIFENAESSKFTKVVSHTLQKKSQKFVDNIINDVKCGQKEIKQGSDSLGNSNLQTYKQETSSSEKGRRIVDPETGVIYFKYDFGYEFGTIINTGSDKETNVKNTYNETNLKYNEGNSIDIPVLNESKSINIPQFKPKKIYCKDTPKWEPTSSDLNSNQRAENWTMKLDNIKNDYTSNSSNHLTSDINYSSNYYDTATLQGIKLESEPPAVLYCTSQVCPTKQQQGSKAPIFCTPMHDIAVVTGSQAKFICIVEGEPCPEISWFKDGIVLKSSSLVDINFRNGVCSLTILHAYYHDVGLYECRATNEEGTASTSSVLTVSERS